MIPESQSLAKFEFVSAVSPGMRGAVEALFFFNPRQRRVREGIRVSVELFGHPKILEQDGKLWIGVSSGATQCLFASDESRSPAKLAGVTRVVHGHTHREMHLALGDPASGGVEYLNTGTWSPAFTNVECTESNERNAYVWITPQNVSGEDQKLRKAELLQFSTKK